MLQQLTKRFNNLCESSTTYRRIPIQAAPNLSAARAFALAASSSRFLGGALVSSEWRRRADIAATSSTAARNEASLALDGLLKPVIFLMNCSEAARTSSALTGGSKLKRVLIFLHIQHDLQQHEFLVCHIDRSWKIVLEQPPNRKVYSRLSRGTDARGQSDGSHKSVGDDAEIERAADNHRTRVVECAPGLVPSAPVNPPSDQRWQPVKFAPESQRRIRVVVADKFLWQVSSEAERPAQSKLLKRTCVAAKCCSTRSHKEKRRLWSRGDESRGLDVELSNGVCEAGALQHARQIGYDAYAAAGDRRTILAIPYVADAEFSGAAADGGQARAAD